MAVPKNKVSKQRKRKRRTHFKLHAPAMTVCPNCGEVTLSHRVCKACGHYKGKEVISQEVEEEIEE